jgi:hypothetical protein
LPILSFKQFVGGGEGQGPEVVISPRLFLSTAIKRLNFLKIYEKHGTSQGKRKVAYPTTAGVEGPWPADIF